MVSSLGYVSLELRNHIRLCCENVFFSRCELLVSILDTETGTRSVQLPHEDLNSVFFQPLVLVPHLVLNEIPCEKNNVKYIFNYLETGEVPEVGRDPNLYKQMYDSFRYLLCTDVIPHISLEDNDLGTLRYEDRITNSDSGELVLLFDSSRSSQVSFQWNYGLTGELNDLSYPLLGADFVGSKKKRLYIPPTLSDAVRRVFGCGGCAIMEFFRDVFTLFHGVLCVAGSACREMFRPERYARDKNNSYEICFTKTDTISATHVIDVVGMLYGKHFGDYVTIRTRREFVFFRPLPSHRQVVRIVMEGYTSLRDVLTRQDIDSDCFVYDGITFGTNQRGLRYLRTNTNIVDLTRLSRHYEARLALAQISWGIGIQLPNFQQRRVISEKTKLGSCRGLGKLLRYLSLETKDLQNIILSGEHDIATLFTCTSQKLFEKKLSSIRSFYQTKPKTYIPFVVRIVKVRNPKEVQNIFLASPSLLSAKYVDQENTDPSLWCEPVLYRRAYIPRIQRGGQWYAGAYSV